MELFLFGIKQEIRVKLWYTIKKHIGKEGNRMSKIDEIRKEMMTAMKNKDKVRKDSLSMLLSALKNAQIDKREELTEAEENAVIAKEMKQTKETMEACPAERTVIIEECQARLSVYKEFAPEEMEEGQIKACIQGVLEELGITEPAKKDRGAIMKVLMPKVRGRADGKLVNQMVSQMLK